MHAGKHVFPPGPQEAAVGDHATGNTQVKRFPHDSQVLRMDGGFAAARELQSLHTESSTVSDDLKGFLLWDLADRVVVPLGVREVRV